MSEALTVHSHFEDVAELAAGLADRVEDGRVILYGPTNYEAGETIPFAILLVDGSTVIEGHGVVAASVDGGEDRDPGFRYDVVLTDLQMDARSEIMFARILMAGETGSRETSLPVEDGGFEQVDVSTARTYGGTGLGLAISRAICQLLGARLEATSVEGSGSTFTIALPSAP